MSLSKEDLSLLKYMNDSGIPHVVTATTNHSTQTATGNTSRHVMMGTGGQGLAVDFAGLHGGRDTSELLAIRYAFRPVEKQCYEIIYYGLGAPPSIKNGHPYTYPKVVQDGHHNHVHVAVDKGVFLKWTATKEHPVALNMPACAVCFTPDGSGYYIVAQDGGVFWFNAPAHGDWSLAGTHLNAPIVDARLTPDGNGMLMLASDGGVFPRGDAVFHGSPAG